MLENCKNAKERWGGVSDIIDRWLQERQELLVLFCQLSEIKDFDGDNEAHGERLRELCQVMVDYVSAGHFEVYDQLIKEGQEFEDDEGLKTASKLFTTIDATTEVALDTNDKYTETDDLETLSDDLNKLGVALESRFKAEDAMIEVLHMAHRDLVA